ncbi:MAG: ATPase, T2SS/T4P/T4SS family [Gammaproteobacteria bacterium]
MSHYASLFTGMPASGSEPPAQAAEPYRILIVDDEPNVLKALHRVFQREHYTIDTAQNGHQALALLERERFHLIISDFTMPRMDGGELLRRVRELRPDIIRIMLTGNADVDAVMGAVKQGAVYRFILKPWNDDDLRVTVALALEQYDLIQKNRSLKDENRRNRREIGILSKLAVTNHSQLAIMLHKRQLLSDRQLQELYKLEQSHKQPVMRVLLERDWVEEKTIRRILREDFLVEEVGLGEFQTDPAATELVPKSFCRRNWVVPLKAEARKLLVAVADPLDDGLREELRFLTGLEVATVMADVAHIEARIVEVYGEGDDVSFAELESIVAPTDPFETIEVIIDEDDDATLEELLSGTEEPPAIRLVNAAVIEAVRQGVSDIHIQPRTKSAVVRYRIDGVLVDKIHIPNSLYPAVVSRLKVMAELDIAERRRPQDGRITVKTPTRIVDLRISTLPTVTGEKVVMRILDRSAAILELEQLGFSHQHADQIEEMTMRPQGIILATGPTGSGKTSTLYSLLQHNASPGKNYVTIEDPVEYFLDMAGQVHVREKIGLTFPSVLRSILRQDPDVILLGEIRDYETAEVAFHAALTGHLVFSTLHTNAASATIARLFDLGLKPYVVATGLGGIIAQRLVRRVCTLCAEEVPVKPVVAARLGGQFDDIASEHRGRGCPACGNTGYKGRVALFELLSLDDAMRDLIGSRASVLEVERFARQQGQLGLIEDARAKVAAGMTTTEEVLRVLGPQPTGSR